MAIPSYSVISIDKPVEITKLFFNGDNLEDTISLVDNSTGGKPVQPGYAKIFRDANTLYVSYLFFDYTPFSSIVKHDDEVWSQDAAELFIDPSGTGKVYYELEVSPNNVTFDAIILNSSETKKSRGSRFQGFTDWDPEGFRTVTRIIKNNSYPYWQSVMALDFNELHLSSSKPPKKGDIWKINLFRIDITEEREAYSSWSPTLYPDFHIPVCFGEILF